MIVSPFALWFVIGSVVAIYSLIDDLFISKNKDVILYVVHKTRPSDLAPLDDKTLLRCARSAIFIIDILLGPTSVFFYYRKTRNMKKFKAEMQNN
ncbi:hypothetical protein CYE47_23120 [Salmonella enterica subsp. enterica serovar Bareilly]|uniref:Phage protein n=2 Tax=Tequintavirus TaxID=187218 RepID=A0A482N2G9_9CAUD|nr:hypothetical protein HWD21_gp129 [Salmonella phage oldekolle]EDN0620662.1 hypothetical protein [Salmonella enterica subsp. enterica serovar Bareilly]QBQ80667.1 hypothetical protein VAH1_00039 [Escherichia phage vB_EcoS_VAH1]QIN99367.1 putative membrane protein [Salmonella phage oldekolle]